MSENLIPMRTALLHAERILTGSKTALLIPAIPSDHYRDSPIRLWADGDWRARDAGFVHGRMVHTVSHYGPYESKTGYVTATGGFVSIRFGYHKSPVHAEANVAKLKKYTRAIVIRERHARQGLNLFIEVRFAFEEKTPDGQ